MEEAAPLPAAPIRVFVVEDQTKILKNQLKLLEGVKDREPPGWLGRTVSDAFNERPWLEGKDDWR